MDSLTQVVLGTGIAGAVRVGVQAVDAVEGGEELAAVGDGDKPGIWCYEDTTKPGRGRGGGADGCGLPAADVSGRPCRPIPRR